MTWKCAALIASAAVAVAADAEAVTGQASAKRALDAFVAAKAIPGYVAVLITPSGEATIAAGGMSATEITGIASVTKVFNTLAAADLVREGKLSFDDPVRAVIPAAAGLPTWESREITLRDLATHTSALPAGQSGQSFLSGSRWYSWRIWRILFRRSILRQNRGPLGGVTWDDMFAFLANTKLERAPGTKFEYSNIGMGMLGLAVETKAGVPWEEAVLSRVCRPIGLTQTTLALPAGTPKPRVHLDLGIIAGAGGLHSSAADLALFVKAALGRNTPKPLAEDFAITFQPQKKDDGGRLLALGWQIDEPTGRLYHAGLTHAYIGIDRKTKVGLAMILGDQLQGIEGLGLAVLEALSGGKPDFPKPRVAVEIPPAKLAALSGVWRYDKDGSVEITVEGKALKAQFMKGKKKGGVAVLWPESETRFFCREWDCTAEFDPAAGTAKIKMYGWEGAYKRER